MILEEDMLLIKTYIHVYINGGLETMSLKLLNKCIGDRATKTVLQTFGRHKHEKNVWTEEMKGRKHNWWVNYLTFTGIF